METTAVNPFAIVIGFGVPGRVVVDHLQSRGIPFRVIELNSATVDRCSSLHEEMVCGNASNPDVLKHAGIENATLIVVAVPDEHAALEITTVARSLNPSAKIITRCHYTSKGMEATTRGADAVVVSEQVVATELARVVASIL